MPTILDAYIQHYKQLIIVISGMSGSNKSEIAGELANKLHAPHINQSNFMDNNFEQVVEINQKKIKIWDSDDAIDFNAFNKAVEEELLLSKVIVVSGVSFNKDKIEFKIDYHIHLKLSKQVLLEKRHNFIKRHATESKYEDVLNLDEQTERQLMNQVTYPYYLKLIENSMINKFLNINEIQIDEISREVLKNVLNFVEQRLYKERKDLKWHEGTGTYEYL